MTSARITPALLLLVALAPQTAKATPSMPLPFSSLSFESTHMLSGIPMHVIVRGTQNKAGIQTFIINAFDKTYHLKREHLEKLKGNEFNGGWVFLEVSESGPIIYIWLVQGSAFGTFNRQLIKLHKTGTIEISDPIQGPFVVEHEKAPPSP